MRKEKDRETQPETWNKKALMLYDVFHLVVTN